MEGKTSEEIGERGLSMYSIFIALIISVFIGASATYIALMISALPWPIILSVVMSFFWLKILDLFRKNKHTIHETNVAQAGGSIGGLIAAGISFTIPAFWYLNEIHNIDLHPPSLIQLIIISVIAGLLGVSLSIPVRRLTIDEEDLPFPSGEAGARTLLAAEEGGVRAEIVLFFGLIAAIYASVLNGILNVSIIDMSFSIGLIIVPVFVFPLLVGVGAGYIIGKNSSLLWFLGAVIGWAVLIPVLQIVRIKNFIDIVRSLGIGIVFGAGLAFFVAKALPGSRRVYRKFFDVRRSKMYLKMPIMMSIISFVALCLLGMNILVAIMGIIGSWVMSAIAGKTTGETNIDPLEQFGLMVGLFTIFFLSAIGFSVSLSQAIMLVAFVSIVSAVAGDIGHDFKSAKIIGTRPLDIIYVDAVACIAGGIIAPIAMYVVISAYYNYIFLAPGVAFQSKLVAEMLYGLKELSYFILGLIFGFVFEIILYKIQSRKNVSISIMPFGIGMFLGFSLAIPIIIGGLIRIYTTKKGPHYEDIGILAVSGIMGGEGIIGFSLGLIRVMGINTTIVSFMIILILSLIGLIIAISRWKVSNL